MQRLIAAAAVAAALVLSGHAADAGPRKQLDPRLTATSIGVGAGATAAYFAIGGWHFNGEWDLSANGLTKFGAYTATTIGCMAVSPMIGSAVVQRPLTLREGQVLTASCLIPIVGGWLVNEAWNAHPEWEQYEAQPRPVAVRVRRR